MAQDGQVGVPEKENLQAAPKIKAEDNPWYLLATLYGVPEERDYELKKNRAAWNRSPLRAATFVNAFLKRGCQQSLVPGSTRRCAS
jgi:hypothetical protein